MAADPSVNRAPAAKPPAFRPPGRLFLQALIIALGLAHLPVGGAGGGLAAATDPAEQPLLARVRENLQRERARLLAYTYLERRHPIDVSPLGKVDVGEELTLEVRPSGDPDRPRRVLVAIAGRPATADEQAEYLRKHERRRSQQTKDDRDEARQKAQERFEDAFRVFTFEDQGTALLDGTSRRVVGIVPRPDAKTRSDMGKWMKRFRGQAWVDDTAGELVRLEMVATDTILLGWGFVGRIAEGTTITYVRQAVDGGAWLPASARFKAHGRTLLLRRFSVDSTTEWFDFRPADQHPSGPGS